MTNEEVMQAFGIHTCTPAYDRNAEATIEFLKDTIELVSAGNDREVEGMVNDAFIDGYKAGYKDNATQETFLMKFDECYGKCSACGYLSCIDYNYCPHCGRKIKK